MMNLVFPSSTESVFNFGAYITLVICEDGSSRQCLLEMVAIVLRSRFILFYLNPSVIVFTQEI